MGRCHAKSGKNVRIIPWIDMDYGFLGGIVRMRDDFRERFRGQHSADMTLPAPFVVVDCGGPAM
jgi:hypothetical protein